MYEMLKSKIHRATVTMCDLNYEGSISIDENLMKAVNIKEYEKVMVVNINNGARFETYVIRAEQGSCEIGLNGAAARLVELGDKVIIFAYAGIDSSEINEFKPEIVIVDDNNKILRKKKV
jgi:aspartate 1-decarboxylase